MIETELPESPSVSVTRQNWIDAVSPVAARSVSNDEHGHESRRRGCEYVGNLEPAENYPHIHSPPGRPKAISVLATLWSDESVPPPPYRVREHARLKKPPTWCKHFT